jgi:hypothetical protein
MYTHIYIYSGPSRPSKCLHTTKIHWPTGLCHISVQKYIGSPAYQNQYTKIHHTIRVPLMHPQLPLPPEEVVAHPDLPQAVVVEHLQDPPAPAAGVH